MTAGQFELDHHARPRSPSTGLVSFVRMNLACKMVLYWWSYISPVMTVLTNREIGILRRAQSTIYGILILILILFLSPSQRAVSIAVTTPVAHLAARVSRPRTTDISAALTLIIVVLASAAGVVITSSTNIVIVRSWRSHVIPGKRRQGRVLSQKCLRQCVISVRIDPGKVHRRWLRLALALRHHLPLVPHSLPLQSFLVQQRPDTYPTGFATEVPPKSVCAGKSSATSPAIPRLQLSLAYKLLLARMQAFVALSVMLSGKGLATHRTHKRPFVRMRAKMRA